MPETIKKGVIKKKTDANNTVILYPKTTADQVDGLSLTTTQGQEAITVGNNTLNIVTRDTAQTISGEKHFTGQVISENQPLLVQSDNYSSYTGADWDIELYADKLVVHNVDLGEAFTLRFPEKVDASISTLATTSDLTEIVDLTSLA